MDRREELVRFYAILSELEKRVGDKRQLGSCTGCLQWPKRGVYFFFEATENRSSSGTGPRIVRVGTHALKEGGKATFWQRLSQHRGTTKGGSHRGSIFRLLIGEAICAAKQNVKPCKSVGQTGFLLGLPLVESQRDD